MQGELNEYWAKTSFIEMHEKRCCVCSVLHNICNSVSRWRLALLARSTCWKSSFYFSSFNSRFPFNTLRLGDYEQNVCSEKTDWVEIFSAKLLMKFRMSTAYIWQSRVISSVARMWKTYTQTMKENETRKKKKQSKIEGGDETEDFCHMFHLFCAQHKYTFRSIRSKTVNGSSLGTIFQHEKLYILHHFICQLNYMQKSHFILPLRLWTRTTKKFMI